jgi:hypothetical protein
MRRRHLRGVAFRLDVQRRLHRERLREHAVGELRGGQLLQRGRVDDGGQDVHRVSRGHLLGRVERVDLRHGAADDLRLDAVGDLRRGLVLQRCLDRDGGQDVHSVRRGHLLRRGHGLDHRLDRVVGVPSVLSRVPALLRLLHEGRVLGHDGPALQRLPRRLFHRRADAAHVHVHGRRARLHALHDAHV